MLQKRVNVLSVRHDITVLTGFHKSCQHFILFFRHGLETKELTLCEEEEGTRSSVGFHSCGNLSHLTSKRLLDTELLSEILKNTRQFLLKHNMRCGFQFVSSCCDHDVFHECILTNCCRKMSAQHRRGVKGRCRL